MHTHTSAHSRTHTCARTRAHMHAYSRAYAHLRIYTYTRTHMHAHTCTRTHAGTHTHARTRSVHRWSLFHGMGPTSRRTHPSQIRDAGAGGGVPERAHRSCRRGERASIRAHAAHAGTLAAAPAPEASRAAQRRMAMVLGAPSLGNMAACLSGQRASPGTLSRCCTLHVASSTWESGMDVYTLRSYSHISTLYLRTVARAHGTLVV